MGTVSTIGILIHRSDQDHYAACSRDNVLYHPARTVTGRVSCEDCDVRCLFHVRLYSRVLETVRLLHIACGRQ